MKNCPHCGEEVNVSATVCRHCEKALPSTENTSGKKTKPSAQKGFPPALIPLGILIAILLLIQVFSVIKSKNSSSPNEKVTATITYVRSESKSETCDSSKVNSLLSYYQTKADQVGAIAKKVNSDGITNAIIQQANSLADEVIAYKYPACAATSHSNFERYVTMMAVSLKLMHDGKATEASNAMQLSGEAFDDFIVEINKLKK